MNKKNYVFLKFIKVICLENTERFKYPKPEL
jgi:hypothetical protein